MLLSWCVCVCDHAYMSTWCMCMHVSIYMNRSQKTSLGARFETEPLIDLYLIKLSGTLVADHWALGICLSMPSQHCHYKHLFFFFLNVGFWGLNFGHHVCKAHTLLLRYLSSPICFIVLMHNLYLGTKYTNNAVSSLHITFYFCKLYALFKSFWWSLEN